MAHWYGCPKAIDCSDPAHPALTGSDLELDQLTVSLKIRLCPVGSRTLAAVVSNGWAGNCLNVVDVTDPLDMSLQGWVASDWLAGAKGLEISL
ncbi:MAG: hypothetical protein JW753_05340 [Dehalococcoidia bacterium]|nr:hypothetical protein [Dehalococcoidia bacterium]